MKTYKQIKTTSNLKVDFTQVAYLQSDINYTILHFIDGSSEVFAYTLKIFENFLGSSFIRIHRSYLVNKQYIDGKGMQKIKLFSGGYLPIARRRKYCKIKT